MLVDSGMDKKYWSEAMLCSTYLVNRIVNAHGVVPAKIWYDKEVNYDRFHTFGCDAYLLISKEKHYDKFDE